MPSRTPGTASRSDPDEGSPTARVERLPAAAEGPIRLRVEGALTRDAVLPVRKALVAAIKEARGGAVEVDLGVVSQVDSAGAALFRVLTQYARERGARLSISAFSEPARHAFELFREPPEPAPPERTATLVRAGEFAYERWRGLVGMLVLTADTVILSIAGARRTGRVRKGAIWTEGARMGADALPIVGLITFLVGVVVALQSAYQLRQFGAAIYTANLIAVSMTREMAPLMTAIMIAGRNGAAVAAEVATMQVSQEIDALHAMGLNPARYVVVPKFKAITVTMPSLTVFANVCGIFGGFLVSFLYLEIGAAAFWAQVLDALVLKDIITGMVKSVAFAWIIVLVAAHRGFQAHGGAESVGLVTTGAVVASIFWVIVADAFFSIIFYFGG